MDIVPILYALRREKLGAILIALQIAVTLTIVCNSLSIIEQRLTRAHRPTGLDEANIFVVTNSWLGIGPDLKARLQADLVALRALPGVIDVEATDALPLRVGRENGWLTLKADQKPPNAWAGYYTLDDHAPRAFGLRMSEGRWFTAEEVQSPRSSDRNVTQVAIVSRALAQALFPSGNALGKQIYYVNNFPMRIVGVVDTLEAAIQPLSQDEAFAEHSLIVPGYIAGPVVTYVIRTQPGRQDALMAIVAKKLFGLNRSRIVNSVKPFSAIRAEAYHGARALSLILGSVSVLLLIVTALGIVGLTSYWVGLRRRQIGVRRALGASRLHILRYFHTENLLIAGCGSLAGIVLALLLNFWLAVGLKVAPMNTGFVLLGAAVVLALGQIAVFWPALRAASISPAAAARSA